MPLVPEAVSVPNPSDFDSKRLKACIWRHNAHKHRIACDNIIQAFRPAPGEVWS